MNANLFLSQVHSASFSALDCRHNRIIHVSELLKVTIASLIEAVIWERCKFHIKQQNLNQKFALTLPHLVSFTMLHNQETFLFTEKLSTISWMSTLDDRKRFVFPLDLVLLTDLHRKMLHGRFDFPFHFHHRSFLHSHQPPARSSMIVCGWDEHQQCLRYYWLASPMQAIW